MTNGESFYTEAGATPNPPGGAGTDVPEPGAFGLMALAMALVGAGPLRHRQRSKA
ncbi:MAG: PEP-CTERM sorting domain-containing protein [Salinisphaera sp.]|nr:PEP-CTERM sorting domain-containing protein [Salinisphaera sp.]